jgi:hypothetical protein
MIQEIFALNGLSDHQAEKTQKIPFGTRTIYDHGGSVFAIEYATNEERKNDIEALAPMK